MNVSHAAEILTSTLMLGLTVIAITVAAVVVNNIIHKYWKPVKLFTPDSWTAFNPPIKENKEPTA